MRRYEDINIAPEPARRHHREPAAARFAADRADDTARNHASPHFELLLRMIDDNGETVGPDRFMSAAVRYQLMPAVDRWVIQEAVRQLTPHAALLADRPVVFTINVSGQSLGEEGFVDFLVEQIERQRH